MSGKWLELLKEMSPNVTRAAIIQDTTIAAGAGQLRAIEAGAPSMGIELRLSLFAIPARLSAPLPSLRACPTAA